MHPTRLSNTSSMMRGLAFQPCWMALRFMVMRCCSPNFPDRLARNLPDTSLVRTRVRKPSSASGNLSNRYLATTKLMTASPMYS